MLKSLVGIFLVLVLAAAPVQTLRAEDEGPRLALVIGNSHYKIAPLATPVNDAGLVAQTLQAAGFDVTGAADLDRESLRKTLRDFVAKVQQAPPNAVVFVYLAGRGLQFAGENYFVPIDAEVQREADIPIAAVRLTDFMRSLVALPAKARILVFDGARALHFATEGSPFASGFAIVNAEPGSLCAFNAAPSTIAPVEEGPYGVYAQALVEMMRQGLSINEVFTETRLRTNQLSAGASVPWDVSQIEAPIFFFTRAAGAPPLQLSAPPENQSLSSFPAPEAYAIAIERDTITAYEDFLAVYPHDPLALRVRALLAARREALTWRRALDANLPEAYWTYMRRYPRGPHFPDSRRRLAVLGAPLDPPPRFDPYDFQGLPHPSDDELEIVDQPEVIFNDPSYPPPPTPPVFILPLRPVEFEHWVPPSPARSSALPIPVPINLPFSKPIAQKPAIVETKSDQLNETAPANTPIVPETGKPPKPLKPPEAKRSGRKKPESKPPEPIKASAKAKPAAPLPPPKPHSSRLAPTRHNNKHRR